MTQPLSLRYRPQTWSEITGQKHVRVVLQRMVTTGQLTPAMLFTGPRGTGKTTTARILAAALNCEQSPAGPCGECVHCKSVRAGNSLDVLEIDAASNGLVGDIRSLREQVLYATSGTFRVVLLDEAHSMSREAGNALLKTLEEPPPSTLFVLLTTEPGKILETVISRCMSFEFRRISLEDIAGRLRYIAWSEPDSPFPFCGGPEDCYCSAGCGDYQAVLTRIADRARGGLRDAVMTLDHAMRVGVKTTTELAFLLGESDFAPQLLLKLSQGDLAGAYEVLDTELARIGDVSAPVDELANTLRDVAVLVAGGSIARQGPELDTRSLLSARLPLDRVLGAMRVLWDLRTRVRGVPARSTVELALAVMAPVLCPDLAASSLTPVETRQAGPMTLEQMRAAV